MKTKLKYLNDGISARPTAFMIKKNPINETDINAPTTVDKINSTELRRLSLGVLFIM
jgi:hypothetical protein